MTIRILQFLAIMVTALALVPPGAHLAALPNKIGMVEVEYFTAQRIYTGWAVLGWLWPAAALLNGGLAFASRAQHWPFWCALLASLCYVLMLGIFLVWTHPANQATLNWVTIPENWQALRRQWEYSHAVNAVIAALALGLTAISALSWRK
jgi:hypothetical protein